MLEKSSFTISSDQGTLERLDLLLEVLFLGGMTVKQPLRIDSCLPDDLNIPPPFEHQVVTKTEHSILSSSIKSKPAQSLYIFNATQE